MMQAAAENKEWKADHLQDLQNARPQLWEIWIRCKQHQILQQCFGDHVDRDAQALVHTWHHMPPVSTVQHDRQEKRREEKRREEKRREEKRREEKRREEKRREEKRREEKRREEKRREEKRREEKRREEKRREEKRREEKRRKKREKNRKGETTPLSVNLARTHVLTGLLREISRLWVIHACQHVKCARKQFWKRLVCIDHSNSLSLPTQKHDVKPLRSEQVS